MSIKVGHIIDFVVPESRRHIVSGGKGVVYKMNYSESLKCYSIYVKPLDSFNLVVYNVARAVYDKGFVFVGKVTDEELRVIQAQMLPFAGPPKSAKTTKKRGGIKIRENAVLTPNTGYEYNQVEGYIRTKKVWAQILRTTKKMAFFDGGKCSINNVTEIRKIQ